MKKLIAIMMIIGFLGIFFSAGPAVAKGGEDNKFTFWYSLPPEHHTLMTELVAEHNKEKPQYTVVVKNFKSPNDLYTALLEGKETPDIALVDASWQEDLVKSDRIVSVEDQMLKIAASIRVVAKMDTFKPLWKSCNVGEKLWTMPYFAVNHALMYNPEMFKDKQITRPPVTWGDLVAMGQKLTDPAKGVWGFYLPMAASPKELAYLYQIFLWQAGGDICKPEELKVAYNSEFGQKALQFWVDIIHKHRIAPSRPDDLSKVAMLVGSTREYLEAKKKGVNFGVVKWPIKNQNVGDIVVTSIAIFKGSPERVEKMWNFTYWLTEFPQASKWSLATHYLPANKQVTLSPEYFSYLEKNKGIRTFIALLEKGSAKPGMRNYEVIMGDLGEKILEALSGRVTVQDALNKAAGRANIMIRQEAGKGNVSSMR
ncbi:MAG: extracellular solute-binding protein [Candidatus Eremiobacteraeota bacterium]|nr:extracellular solute-binding protein [Candidatus Eremiobacteraeota bacterium]